MKKSYILAAIILGLAFIWVMTGQFGDPIHQAETVSRDLGTDQSAEAPVPVRVKTIRALAHQRDLVLLGLSEADRKVQIRARTNGPVAEIQRDQGSSLSEGETILTLALEAREAKLQEAKASEERYRLAYEAGRNLNAKSFRSRVTLSENKADWEASKARLTEIGLDIEYTTIKAPFNGILDRLVVEKGDYLQTGDTIATIVDLDPLVISGEISETDMRFVTPGMSARVDLGKGEALDGVIRYLSKTGHPQTRTFRIEVAVQNPDNDFAEGLTAELRLRLGETMAHLVSPAVLTLSGDGVVGVKAVDSENRVVFYKSEIVADTPDGMWLGGLPDPVTLITVGQEFVREGQSVSPVKEVVEPASQLKPNVAPGEGGELRENAD